MQITIQPGYWQNRIRINAEQSIFHQWEMLEETGCIQNFRIAAGEVEGLREGWFFSDSDAYKWVDAAARICGHQAEQKLADLMESFITLIGLAQQSDGYIFTYNQIHFPGIKWQNLQIEHELYCHGHLIEAGVSHFQASGKTNLLDIARKAADCIVRDFAGKDSRYTPGHEEIEIALLRLYEVTDHRSYLEMAEQFIHQRGKIFLFGLNLLRQSGNSKKRLDEVKVKRQNYLKEHPEYHPCSLPAGNAAKIPKYIHLRWAWNTLSGKFFQQHKPVRSQMVPEGHSVRYTYLTTASAMLDRLHQTQQFLPTLKTAWERMITRRMFLTGGLGSLPVIEGFGRDYELDPEFAYTETCAGIGSFLWNWEMAQLTGDACYSDLMEWQLYNAISVGMGLDGKNFLYNNPLACHGGITRKAWYEVPCCPSNLSRLLASLEKYIFSTQADTVWVHQYISSTYQDGELMLEMRSGLPWEGGISIKVLHAPDRELTLHIRIPSWSKETKVRVNGEEIPFSPVKKPEESPACGVDPRLSHWLTIHRKWKPGDQIVMETDMSPVVHFAHPKVKPHRSQAALTRGPLVYCLESVDNPDVDIFTAAGCVEAITQKYCSDVLGDIQTIQMKTSDNKKLNLIPYFLWGNRGKSTMTVWFNHSKEELCKPN
jgi:DUF1680 family protein